MFDQYCKEMLAQFGEEEVKKVPPIILREAGKSTVEAEESKQSGNEYFARKEYDKAISSYNKGVRYCPQNEASQKELFTILVSNRSAALFEKKCYSEALKDIDYLLKTGGYPKNLLHKVWLRKAKCYDALSNIDLALECYEIAEEYVALSNLDEKSKLIKTGQIQQAIRNIQTHSPAENSNVITNSHTTEDFIHNSVFIDEDKVQGRFARATENIDAGVKIIDEKPYASVLHPKNFLTNCQHCLLPVSQTFACPDCSEVVFCSLSCLKAAKIYHNVECLILPTLHHSEASVNYHLALRLVTQKTASFFVNPIQAHDPYKSIYSLCRHEEATRHEVVLAYTGMVSFLLCLLKKTDFFSGCSEDAMIAVGNALLRHLQLLQFNSHEISELRNVAEGATNRERSYESTHIGAGIYPTLSLFNHSCDPSIVRYNIGNRVLVHTIKPIKSNEIIYENYGPIYTTTEKEERQKYLKERYNFECLCQPCTEMWSSLDQMRDDILRVPCKRPKCPKIYEISKTVECPFLTCDLCNEMTSLFPYLKGLMGLERVLPQAEEAYKRGEYEKAMGLFLQAISMYYKYSAPPFPDLVNVQQRLRSCMVHLGNKCVGYVDPSNY